MNLITLILVFIGLAILDFVAALLALEKIGASSSLPAVPSAAAIHFLVAAIGCFAVIIFPGMRERPGYRTIGLFAGCLCLLTPVVGPLAAAWFVRGIFRREITLEDTGTVRLGNPLRRQTLGQATPATTPVTEPLAISLGYGHVPGQRQAAPLLRRKVCAQSVALLRRLFVQPDARTQLYSQSALSSVLDTCELKLAEQRRQAAQDPDDPWREDALASMLIEFARLGIYPETESETLLVEASARLDRAIALAPGEPPFLYRKAECLIEMGSLDGVPDLYGRLCALPGGQTLAEELESRYFSAMGNWHRAATAVERTMQDESDRVPLDEATKEFWTCRATFGTAG